MSKRISPSKIRAVLGDKVADKIGNYKESTGGGTPIPKGEKLKDHPEAKRVQQPRDEEGQFTYNAVNNKPLKYPSRGETIPPFLKDVNLDNLAKKGKVTVIHDGNRYQTILNQSVEEMINNFKSYDVKKGFKEWSKEIATKRGRKTQSEKEAIEKGESGVVPSKEKNKEKTPEKPAFKQPEVQTNKKFDTELAKNNPMEFAMQNKDAILKLMEENPDLSPTQIISLIASGKI